MLLKVYPNNGGVLMAGIHSPDKGPPVPEWMPGWPWREETKFFRGESNSERGDQGAGDSGNHANPVGEADSEGISELSQAEPRGGEKSTPQVSGSDVDLNKVLTLEQKEWVLKYLSNWNNGIKRFYNLREEELKPKFRVESKARKEV
jgi:hypothetical protein